MKTQDSYQRKWSARCGHPSLFICAQYKGVINLHASGATEIYLAGVLEKIIQQQTDHCSVEALSRYENTSQQLLQVVANILIDFALLVLLNVEILFHTFLMVEFLLFLSLSSMSSLTQTKSIAASSRWTGKVITLQVLKGIVAALVYRKSLVKTEFVCFVTQSQDPLLKFYEFC